MEVVMKIGAIIAEYNPFHNGHKYQIEKFKKESGLDYVIVIMSGNFTQRGEPAWMPKHSRAKMALLNGADLVIELPLYYATGSASVFAEGAIAHLNALGCVEELCFGCESGEGETDFFTRLDEVSDIILNEPERYKKILTEALKKGYPYPSAREQALEYYVPNASAFFSPNNILALEYMIALKKTGSHIKPVPIRRIGQGYHSLESNDYFVSASALRHKFTSVSDCQSAYGIPNTCLEIISQQFCKSMPIYMNDFSASFANSYLEHKEKLTEYIDMNEDISNLIHKNFPDFTKIDDLVAALKTKTYTYTRLSRCILHLLTNQKKEDFQLFVQNGYAFYARILGFQKDAAPLLNCIKHNASIPMLTKIRVYKEQLNSIGIRMFEQDLRAADLYRTMAQIKYDSHLKNEFTEQLVILHGRNT